MTTLIASPNPSSGEMSLALCLSTAQPFDSIKLRGGDYLGTYSLRTKGVIVETYEGEPARLVGPEKPVANTKPTWLHIAPSAAAAVVRNVRFERPSTTGSSIVKAKDFNDFGVVVEAPDVRVESCYFAGMTKGLHVKDKTSTGVTIVRNTFGSTYQSNIAVGTSYGVLRKLLIAWNEFGGSYAEDGVQLTQDFLAANKETDVSNLGAILYCNIFHDLNENAIDLKGAAYIVAEGNMITRIMGSNNGLAEGQNHGSPMAIMHGANASKDQRCQVLIRNNVIRSCAGGIRVFSGWHVVHNLLMDNNWIPDGSAWKGTGILQRGDPTGAAIKNNQSHGHLGADWDFEAVSPDFAWNSTEPGPAIPLTVTREAGAGRILPLRDAGYFTDWFGRAELPPDVLYLGGERYEVRAVDYAANTVELDRDLSWQDSHPVCWRSPEPVVGVQEEYVPPPPVIEPPVVVEPPPVVVEPPVDPPLPDEPTEPPTTPEEPPADEIVSVVIDFALSPLAAAQLRALLAGATMRVE